MAWYGIVHGASGAQLLHCTKALLGFRGRTVGDCSQDVLDGLGCIDTSVVNVVVAQVLDATAGAGQHAGIADGAHGGRGGNVSHDLASGHGHSSDGTKACCVTRAITCVHDALDGVTQGVEVIGNAAQALLAGCAAPIARVLGGSNVLDDLAQVCERRINTFCCCVYSPSLCGV